MCFESKDLGRAVLDIGNCVIMAEKARSFATSMKALIADGLAFAILQVPKCHKMMQKNCIDTHDFTSCQMWSEYCMGMWEAAPVLAGVNT